MDRVVSRENVLIRSASLLISLYLFGASVAAGIYTGELNQIWPQFITMISSPGITGTDYFMTASLGAALFNAAWCGLVCAAGINLMKGFYKTSVWAGFFLVIAHCFYGLNFFNMWPPMVGVYIFCKFSGKRFRDTLDYAMLSTSFGPFVSEILFRYPLGQFWRVQIGPFKFGLSGLLILAGFILVIGFAIPALLPYTQRIHRGFNLYNAGLAFSVIALFLYAFLYRTLGQDQVAAPYWFNSVYNSHGNGYTVFLNIMFIGLFLLVIIIGIVAKGGTWEGYKELLTDSSIHTNFIHKYGVGNTWINLGVSGLMMLAYMDIVVWLTEGVSFTGPTCGVIIASLSFTAAGQHPKNVWPILAGYIALFAVVGGGFTLAGAQLPWTLSTQAYINGIAFATGLCPFTGVYGRKVGMIAGMVDAILCTSTSMLYGSLLLYNGGAVAGFTAMFLVPLLELYKPLKPAEKEKHGIPE